MLRKGGKNTQKNYTEKGLMIRITMMVWSPPLESDILECEIKWALGSITMNKPSGDDGIQDELFKILKDDAISVLKDWMWKWMAYWMQYDQQIWKAQ